MNTDRTIPDTGAVFLLFAIILGVYLFICLLLKDLPQEGGWHLVNLFAPELLALLLPTLVFIKVKQLNLRVTLKINTISFTTGLMIFFITVMSFIIIAGVHDLLSPLFRTYEERTTRMVQQLVKAAEVNIVIFLIGVTIVPAICEEMLFRGFILSGLQTEHGKTRAIILSALLFGLLHFVPSQVVLMTLFGILLGWLTIRTGSILVPILMHFVHNVLAVIVLLQPDCWHLLR